MVTLLITSFFLFVAISYAIYLWQRPSSDDTAKRFLSASPPQFRSLFDNVDSPDSARTVERGAHEISVEQRAACLARAAQCEKEALLDAHALGDKNLYAEVLNRLLAQAHRSGDELRSLVAYIVEHQHLRANQELAEAFCRVWKSTPDRASTARMLRVAALSDDAKMFRKAVETAIELRRSAGLNISTQELSRLVESEYWMLAPETRSSGAGFVLKETIARLRSEHSSSPSRD